MSVLFKGVHYDMMVETKTGTSKTVKMHGAFSVNEIGDKRYYACIIKDATACCAQGIEFVLKDPKRFPDEYPAVNQDL